MCICTYIFTHTYYFTRRQNRLSTAPQPPPLHHCHLEGTRSHFACSIFRLQIFPPRMSSRFVLAKTCDVRRHVTTHKKHKNHCNTLQHTATYCNTLQRSVAHCSTLRRVRRHVTTHTKHTLQHTALCATHCNTLQHTVHMCVVCVQHNVTTCEQTCDNTQKNTKIQTSNQKSNS